MATESEILDILATLQAAFPSYRPTNPQASADLYIRKLSRFNARALQTAADQVIDQGRFFPAIGELVRAAQKAEKTGRNNGQDDWMRAQAQALEDQVYLEGEFNPEAWEQLAIQMTNAGRMFSADRIRERACQMAAIYAEPVQ